MNRSRALTTPADRLVIILAILGVAGLYSLYWQPGVAGTTVEYQTPREHGRLNLGQDQTLALTGADGPSRIRIQDGKARFIASPCRNKHCIHSGWLSEGGDYAACLPNQVTLLVHGQQQLDAINY